MKRVNTALSQECDDSQILGVHPAGPALTPLQRRVVDDLMATGRPRPSFPADLSVRLLDALEQGVAPFADRVGQRELALNKAVLSQLHACERHHVAEAQQSFRWSVKSARGTVAHRALQLSVFSPDDVSPLDLVDRALERFAEEGEDWGPATFLACASGAELAELRGEANDIVAKFQECFPPLKSHWRPRLESSAKVELAEGRIVLRAKVDLALGRATDTTARVLVVDFKTGRGAAHHVDDLRFYALVETIRSGVPPFRVATFYLESGRWTFEDVTTDVLDVTVRRVVAAITKLVELRIDRRRPAVASGPRCGWCVERATCEGAAQWQQQREELGLDERPAGASGPPERADRSLGLEAPGGDRGAEAGAAGAGAV